MSKQSYIKNCVLDVRENDGYGKDGIVFKQTSHGDGSMYVYLDGYIIMRKERFNSLWKRLEFAFMASRL